MVPTQIRSMTSADTYDGEAQDLQQDLAEHPAVNESHVNTSRRPHRVMADVEALPLPEGVRDILEQHHASIEQVEGGNGGLLLTLRPAKPWKPAGQRTIRAHGGSIVCTLTREALEASGLDEDVEVDIEAREDQVRITRREA
ncbi:hypothetical protein M201_gp01 [Haloarcula californiae tailed virus 2]|uniref:Uncharacterized protein n=1 Tax=Haloarcula californiae tailed virus 2 TaxID=1273747 RepID=R4TNH5_9CAUD|nr:hypothetical protein M201_gp01 [Haloarcula californiae tailed virus 2]AGM11778.1 hypothetical protein HCTV2_1 [Haloarcula californiae tailed virus 2]